MPDSIFRFGLDSVTKRRWSLLRAAAVLALTGCGANAATQPTPTAHSTPTMPITIQIKLDQTRVGAGKPIKGQAVLTNTTSQDVTVEQCARNGWLKVGVVNSQIQFDPPFTEVACAPSIRLMPGINRFPITVATTYQECLGPGRKSITYIPPCPASGEPPLPAGTYRTKVVAVGLPASAPVPGSLTVTVTLPD